MDFDEDVTAGEITRSVMALHRAMWPALKLCRSAIEAD
jgi:hypothetical protein